MPCDCVLFRLKLFGDGVDDNCDNVACRHIDNMCHYDNGIYGDFSEEAGNRCCNGLVRYQK